MIEINRFEKELEEARLAGELLNNNSFVKAVSIVLNRYAETEERIILEDNSKDFREQARRVQHQALARRCLLDVVAELTAMVNKGDAIRSLDD